jgi:hypothetical protein
MKPTSFMVVSFAGHYQPGGEAKVAAAFLPKVAVCDVIGREIDASFDPRFRSPNAAALATHSEKESCSSRRLPSSAPP